MDDMTPRELTLYWHAQVAFQQALNLAKHLISLNIADADPRSAMFLGAIFGYYGRPFKNSRGIGSLSESIVPPTHKFYHDYMLELRDEVFLHTDSGAKTAEGKRVNELKFITDENGKIRRVESMIRMPTAEIFAGMCDLIKILLEITKVMTQRYIEAKIPEESFAPNSIYSLKISGDNIALEKES